MKRLSFSVIALFAIVFAPLSALADSPSDLYADALQSVSGGLLDGANAVGAPDQVYASFLDTDATITLDMGEGEAGTGDLTLYFVQYQFGTSYLLDFLDENSNIIKTGGGSLPLYQSSTVVVYGEDIPYRYVRIRSQVSDAWKLDAIQAETVETVVAEPVVTPPPPSQDTTTEPPVTTTETARGLTVKLVDDGNPATTVDSAVYVIDGENGRHVFPNETVYRTWFPDDENLAFIDPTNLASYALQSNVTVRPGTYLIKIVSDPKVYAIEPGGVLRWIPSEPLAIDLYGADWATRVIDVDVSFFNNYTMGPDITITEHPNGTLGSMPDGRVVYIKNGVAYNLPGDTMAAMRFQSQFVTPILEKIAPLYVDGGDLPIDPEIQWPF